MGFAHVWALKMEEKYWQDVVLKDVPSWLFLTKWGSSNWSSPLIIMGNNDQNRSNRLKSTTEIALLFEQGKSVFAPPLSCRWRLKEGSGLVKVAFAASKRKFPKAVTRNRLKRIMREAYRLNPFNEELIPKEKDLNLMFFFNAPKEGSTEQLHSAVRTINKKIGSKIAD